MKKLIFRLVLAILVVFWVVGPVQSAFAGIYSGGYGSEANPYRISTPEDMNSIGAHPNDWDQHFVLTNNIDLSAYTGTEFNIIGTFTGVFDGNSHTISNFTYETSSARRRTGLFGYVGDANALVKDLHLTNPNVDVGYNSRYVGCLVGDLKEGHITGCSVTTGSALLRENSMYYGASAGGLVGRNYKGTISNCHATANVTGSCFAGGLVGYNSSGTISNCYTAGSVTDPEGGVNGGLVGSSYKGTISNCYSATNVSAGWMGAAGGLVGNNGSGCMISNCYATGSVTGGLYTGGLVGGNSGAISKCYATGSVTGSGTGGLVGVNEAGGIVEASFWDVETTNQQNSAGGEPKTTAQMQTATTFVGWGCDGAWTIDDGNDYPRLAWENMPGETLNKPLSDVLSGTGTCNDPYLINTDDQLNMIGASSCEWDGHFRLMADIDLGSYTGTTFNIIGNSTRPFTGVFDGNGNTISNFTYTVTDTNYIGLFGYVDDANAVIKDLTLVAPYVSAAGNSDYVGSLVGRLESGTITGCGIDGGCVVGGDTGTGGLVGANSGTISNCYSTAIISGYISVGGLVAENTGSISDCCAKGIVCASEVVGGLAGKNYAAIERCYSTGSIFGVSYAGGLVGVNEASGIVEASFWDVNSSNMDTSDGGQGKTTAEMQTITTFTGAGWDFVGEQVNGREDIWRMCVDGLDYPKLAWQFMLADFVCPDGVEFNDLDVFTQQWLMEKLSADVAPSSGDGVVDFSDWAILADGWQNTIDLNNIAVFAGQWLRFGAYCADIVPTPAGDGVVDMLDFAVLAEHWLERCQ